MLAETEIDAVAGDGHSGQEGVPLVAPSITVVVTGEDGHEARSRGDGLHEGHVLTAVDTGRVVRAILTPTLGLLGQDVVVVDTRLAVRVDASFGLEGLGRIGGDVDEGEGGNHATILCGEGSSSGLEPCDDAGVDPVGLPDLGAGGVKGLKIEATTAVEEPKEEGRCA